MSENDELFGGVNLMTQTDEIEIPDVVEGGSGGEDTKTPETKESKPSKSVDNDEFEVDDDTFELPEVEEEETTTELDEDEENIDGEKPSSPPEEKDSSSPSPIEPFAKALFEEGVLTKFDEEGFREKVKEVGEVEALFETVKDTIQSEIEAFKAEADEDYQNFLKARDEGLDLNEYASISAKAKKYSSIEENALEEDEKLQKSLVRDYLKAKGFDDEEISDTIESYEDTAKLVPKAKLALKNLIKDEKEKSKKLEEDTKLHREQVALAIEQQRKDLKKLIDDTKHIIPEVSMTGNEKKRIYELITQPVDKDNNGNPINAIMKKRLENPLKYAMLEAYYNDLGFFDEKFEKLTKKAKSNSIKDFAKALESGATIGSPKGKPAPAKKSDGSDPDFEDAWGRLNL